MPKVRWDFYEDYEDFDNEEDYSKFEKIKQDNRAPYSEEDTPNKKKSSVKHQHRPNKN